MVWPCAYLDVAQEDVPAPVLLEAEIALGLRIHLGVQVVLLGPQGIGGIEVLEVRDQPRAVEAAGAQVAGERRQPAPAEQPAGVAHRVLAPPAGPVRERRAGHDDRAEELRPHRGGHQDLPTCLAVADHHRLALALRVQSDDALQECRFGAHHVLDCLSRHRVGQEPDEIAGVAGAQGDPDLAVGLEAADARPVSGPRIEHHEWPLARIGGHVLGEQDADQPVVDRPLEIASRHDRLEGEVEYVRHRLAEVLLVLVAAPAHHVGVQRAALPGVDGVLRRGLREAPSAELERIEMDGFRFVGAHVSSMPSWLLARCVPLPKTRRVESFTAARAAGAAH